MLSEVIRYNFLDADSSIPNPESPSIIVKKAGENAKYTLLQIMFKKRTITQRKLLSTLVLVSLPMHS